ncbi:MAG: hypothetical protein AB1899_14715 [Pseudomonadota bacterium]
MPGRTQSSDGGVQAHDETTQIMGVTSPVMLGLALGALMLLGCLSVPWNFSLQVFLPAYHADIALHHEG